MEYVIACQKSIIKKISLLQLLYSTDIVIFSLTDILTVF